MNEQSPAAWKAILLSYPCDSCGAPAGQPCITRNGNRYDAFHVARGRAGSRCSKCGTRLPSTLDHGSLCDYCAHIRALELERISHYRRTD